MASSFTQSTNPQQLTGFQAGWTIMLSIWLLNHSKGMRFRCRSLNMGSPNALRLLSTESRPEREVMEYDVVIVGAGPAGLSASIRLKQLAQEKGREISVCVVEKGSAVGAHILSGNVFDPSALDALLPDWKQQGAPVKTAVTQDNFLFLTEKSSIRSPFLPAALHNKGNYIISLSQLCVWLGEQAEALGVEVYPGFSASELLIGDKGEVQGIVTADMGIDKEGKQKDSYQRGIELRAKQTLLAEGCRGSLSEQAMSKYNLRRKCDVQTYGLGLKEVWQVPAGQHKPGLVTHTLGWPVPDSRTWMGSFLYHMDGGLVALGLVVGLDYENPHINPYREFQKWKHHPAISQHIK
eukprot:g40500.t1